jgi:hypothetical protein
MSSTAAVLWSGTLTLPGLEPFAAEALGAPQPSGAEWDIVPQAVAHMGRTDGPALSRYAAP